VPKNRAVQKVIANKLALPSQFHQSESLGWQPTVIRTPRTHAMHDEKKAQVRNGQHSSTKHALQQRVEQIKTGQKSKTKQAT